ncbi:MAG: dTDP-glucose 4,6-dehydratase [Nitrospinales bacterium]
MSAAEKTILITGGAGFIGSNFVNHLYKKYPRYKLLLLDALTYAGNLDNLSPEMKTDSRFQFFQGDITHLGIVNELVSQSDVVVHFAAESHVTRSIYDNTIFFQTDVMGTHALANAAVNQSVERFIHISSSEVYGTALENPMDEDHPLNPLTPYAAAKAGADRLIYAYVQTYNIPAVIVRPFNNYGPFQHIEKAIPNFIISALQDQPVTIHGEGACSRDWMYVQDTCEAVDKILHTDRDSVVGEIINLGTGEDTSVLTLAKRILEILKKPQDLIAHVPDRPGQVSRHISSTEKARDLIDWKHSVSLDEGLVRTVRFYQQNQKWWERYLWTKEIWKQ